MSRDPNRKIAIIGEAGGMRNALTAGFVIGSKLKPEYIDAYYGVSSAVGNGAYFLAKQDHEAYRMWTEVMTKKEVFDPRNILRKTHPIDLDYLVDIACGNLDVEAVINSHADFVIVVVREHDGKPVYLRPSPEQFRHWFKATCAIPVVAREIDVDGVTYVDGGVFDPLPILQAYKDGYRNFLVLANREEQYRDPYDMNVAIVKRFGSAGIQRAIENLRPHYKKTWDFILNPPNDVRLFLFTPPNGITISAFERDADKVELSFHRGRMLGEKAHDALMRFLEVNNPSISE